MLFAWGKALCLRWDRLGEHSDALAAAAALGEAVSESEELQNHYFAFESARWLANLASLQNSWADASAAYGRGMRALERLLALQVARPSKEDWLSKATDFVTDAAYAACMCGDLRTAVATLERGRATLFADSAAHLTLLLQEAAENGHKTRVQRFLDATDQVRRLQGDLTSLPASSETGALAAAQREVEDGLQDVRSIPGLQSFLATPTFEDAVEAARIAPIVYLLSVRDTGLALIVRSDGTVQPLFLPDLRDEELVPRVNDYADKLDKLSDDDVGSWLQTLRSLLAWLWRVAMAAVLDAVGEPDVVLIPTGLLAILPLHAAGEAQGSATCFLDRCAPSYAPSARALLSALDAADTAPAESILAVEEPKPTSAGLLPAAAAEVAAALSHFVKSDHLSGRMADRRSILRAIPGHNVLHFACHAFAVPQEPLAGGLLVSGDQVLTVADFLRLRLSPTRLAVLSACETALPGGVLLDEVVGLPSALLQAGLGGVIGSLWPVPDTSTMLLMSRFYKLWREKGMGPRDALAGAQRWLKAVSIEELQTDYASVTGQYDAGMADSSETRPYASPYHWAGFVYVGG